MQKTWGCHAAGPVGQLPWRMTSAGLTLGETEKLIWAWPYPTWIGTQEPHPGFRPGHITQHALMHVADSLGPQRQRPSLWWLACWCSLNEVGLPAVYHLEKMILRVAFIWAKGLWALSLGLTRGFGERTLFSNYYHMTFPSSPV